MSNHELNDAHNIQTSPVEVQVNRKSVVITTIRQILLSVVAVILAATILVIAYRQENNTTLLKQVSDTSTDVKSVLNFLLDCTTPGHKCYDDATKSGKSRSTEIETVISNTIIATGTCRAEGKDTNFTVLKNCVDKLVK